MVVFGLLWVKLPWPAPSKPCSVGQVSLFYWSCAITTTGKNQPSHFTLHWLHDGTNTRIYLKSFVTPLFPVSKTKGKLWQEILGKYCSFGLRLLAICYMTIQPPGKGRAWLYECSQRLCCLLLKREFIQAQQGKAWSGLQNSSVNSPSLSQKLGMLDTWKVYISD